MIETRIYVSTGKVNGRHRWFATRCLLQTTPEYRRYGQAMDGVGPFKTKEEATAAAGRLAPPSRADIAAFCDPRDDFEHSMP